MNVTATTSSPGITTPQGGAPKPEPHALWKTSDTARAAQSELVKSFNGLDTGSVLTAPGLKMLLGEPTTVANLKDGVVHLLHKVSDSLLPNSKGSHYKEALRLADEYQALKTNGGSEEEKLEVLRNLKHELEHHSPGGAKGELVGNLAKFVAEEITILETGVKMDQQDTDARLAQDQSRVDVIMQELSQDRSVSGHGLRDEIRGFDRSSLNPVDAPKDQGVPRWAKMEFTYNSLKSDTIDATPQGTVKSPPLLLPNPGLSALTGSFQASPEFTTMGAKVETALVAGGGAGAMKTLTDDIARELVKDISSQGKLSETAFAISDGAKFKKELFEAFKAGNPGGAKLTGKYEDAPPDVQAFFDGVYKSVLDQLPDRQTAADKVVIGGKEYTKGALLGEGGFGSVHLYEHQREVTDPLTGKKSTVVEQIAVKSLKAGNLDAAAAEVRAHQSAMGPGGHEHIIGMKGVIQTQGGGLLIAMDLAKTDAYELLDNLKQAVDAGRISPVAANAVRLTILRDMMRGLQHFQEERGMTHLDVKEPNYFVGPDGRVKLGDFGFARTGHQVLEGSIVDNPIWKAPELLIQEREREKIGTDATNQKRAVKEFLRTQNLTPEEFSAQYNEAAADIDATAQLKLDMLGGVIATNKADTWSVGITAYKLFHGEDPFNARFFSETIEKIVEHGSDPDNTLGTLGQNLDGTSTGKAVTALDRLVNDMLNPDPTKRPSITDLLRNPIFDEPFVGGGEAYAIIQELSEKTPDPAKLKSLSDSLGV